MNTIDPPLAAIMELASLAARQRVSMLIAETAMRIADEVRASGAPCVWVEGFSDAGKSHMAGKLAYLLGWRHVQLDGLVAEVQPDAESYADRMDATKVAALLGTRERRARSVVDGICLRDVLQRFDAVDADAFVVYVAKVTNLGESLIWHDGFHIEDGPTQESMWIQRDAIGYHLAQHLYANARHILLRVEEHTP